MFVKSEIKLTLLTAAAVLMLAGGVVYADSAVNSGTLVSPASSTANQMFLLDSGTIDYMPAGKRWIGMDTTGACTGDCASLTHNKGLCPKGFVPYFVTSPFKSAQTQTSSDSRIANVGANAICVSNWNVTNPPAKTYNIGFGLTSTSTGGTVSLSGSAFNWYIYCYPGTYVATNVSGNPNGATYNNAQGCDDNPATCRVEQGSIPSCNVTSLAPTGADKQVLLWDTGFYTNPPPVTNPPQTPGWLYTNRLCPYNYYPHIVLSPNKSVTSSYLQTGSSSSQPNTTYVCPVSTVAYPNPGAAIVQEGTHYLMQLKASSLVGSASNIGTQWSLYCYPGSTWTGSTPEYDNTCDTSLPASPQPDKMTWTYIFAPTIFNQRWGNIRYNSVQSYSPSNKGAPLFFIGGVGGSPSTPDWLVIPMDGTYVFSLNLIITFRASFPDAYACIFFYLNNDSPATRFTSTSPGTPSIVYVPATNVVNVAGMAVTSLQTAPAYYAKGTGIQVKGWVFDDLSAGCATGGVVLDVPSNGSLTMTRTGP